MSLLHRYEPPKTGVNDVLAVKALARPTFPRQCAARSVLFRRCFTVLRTGGITSNCIETEPSANLSVQNESPSLEDY
jgi:hypothetical protein